VGLAGLWEAELKRTDGQTGTEGHLRLICMEVPQGREMYRAGTVGEGAIVQSGTGGTVGLWDCGTVDCGLWTVGLWDCGTVGLWTVDCGQWDCGTVGLWTVGLWTVDCGTVDCGTVDCGTVGLCDWGTSL
jgi:hypothetical protein